MRTRLLLAAIVTAAFALIGWQRLTINRLRAGLPAEEKTTSPGSDHSDDRGGRRIPAPPPADTSDPALHLAHLKLLAALPEPAEQTLGATEWAVSLQSPESLEVALAALADPQSKDPKRLALAARFGPALFARWGRIAPLEGLAAWDRIPAELRLAISPAPRGWRPFTSDPLGDWAADNLPLTLLEAWLAADPAGFLTHIESRIRAQAADPLAQVCLRLAIRLKPIEVLSWIASSPKAAALADQQVALADALVAAAGTPDESLARLAAVADSPLRQLVEKELSDRVAAAAAAGRGRGGRRR